MNRTWKVILLSVSSVGCLGLAGLVGFMVATRLSANGASPAPASSVPVSNGGRGRMMVDMTPDEVRAQHENGPWMNNLVLSRGTDGVMFGAASTVVEHAGVPSMTRSADGTLYLAFQWFPEDNDGAFDKIAVQTSSDDGVTWTEPLLIVIDGMPSAYVRPYDPTIVVGDDGIFHLFFTTGTTKMQDVSFIASAIGTDGVHYTWQDGARMDVADAPNYDAALATLGDRWYMVTPRKPEVLGATSEAYVASSDDGVAFSDAVVIEGAEGAMNWTGNMLVDGGLLWFYGASVNTTPGLWRASSTDGTTWSEPQDLVSDGGGDPAIVQTADGEYILVTVSAAQK